MPEHADSPPAARRASRDREQQAELRPHDGGDHDDVTPVAQREQRPLVNATVRLERELADIDAALANGPAKAAAPDRARGA